MFDSVYTAIDADKFINDINSIDDLWEYVNRTLIPAITHDIDPTSDCVCTNQDMDNTTVNCQIPNWAGQSCLLDAGVGQNRLFGTCQFGNITNGYAGGILIRQNIVTNVSCPSFATLVEPSPAMFPCYGEWSEEVEDKFAFSGKPFVNEFGFTYIPSGLPHLHGDDMVKSQFAAVDYGESGYALTLPAIGLSTSRNLLATLRENSWIYSGTRAVAIDFNIYNAANSMLLSIRLLIEFGASGGITRSTSFRHISFDILNLSFSVPAIIYFLLLVMQTLVYIIQTARFCIGWRRNPARASYYCCQADNASSLFWGMMLLTSYALFWASAIWFFILYAAAFRLFPVKDFPSTIFPDCGPWDNLYIYAKLYHDFEVLCSIAFLLGLLCAIRRIPSRTVQMIFVTLGAATKELILLGSVLIIYVLGFAVAAYIMFGSTSNPFSTYSEALKSVNKLLFTSDIDLEALTAQSDVSAPIFYVVFLISMNVVVLNIFVAIIVSSFEKYKDLHEQWGKSYQTTLELASKTPIVLYIHERFIRQCLLQYYRLRLYLYGYQMPVVKVPSSLPTPTLPTPQSPVPSQNSTAQYTQMGSQQPATLLSQSNEFYEGEFTWVVLVDKEKDLLKTTNTNLSDTVFLVLKKTCIRAAFWQHDSCLYFTQSIAMDKINEFCRRVIKVQNKDDRLDLAKKLCYPFRLKFIYLIWKHVIHYIRRYNNRLTVKKMAEKLETMKQEEEDRKKAHAYKESSIDRGYSKIFLGKWRHNYRKSVGDGDLGKDNPIQKDDSVVTNSSCCQRMVDPCSYGSSEAHNIPIPSQVAILRAKISLLEVELVVTYQIENILKKYINLYTYIGGVGADMQQMMRNTWISCDEEYRPLSLSDDDLTRILLPPEGQVLNALRERKQAGAYYGSVNLQAVNKPKFSTQSQLSINKYLDALVESAKKDAENIVNGFMKLKLSS